MADRGLTRVLQSLRPAPDADGQLLARFVAGRDDAAFAALVRRHGPMVYGVCRRVLGHAQDAEDAFQAAFLVLARKAGSVVKRDSLGSWLYSVAHRTALEARSVLARRRAREKQRMETSHPAVAPEEPQDWRPLLDRELRRLPEKYRAAVVLCDLEGRPRKEVARRLRVPEGTLSSRLAAARRMLARRLTLRGLALSGGGLAAALSGGAATAAVPAALASATARAAALDAIGRPAAAGAAALAEAVLRSLWASKLKAALALALVLAAAGAGAVAWRGRAGVQPDDRVAAATTGEAAPWESGAPATPPAAPGAGVGPGAGPPREAAGNADDRFVVEFKSASLTVEWTPDPEAEARDAFEALRSAKGEEEEARAVDALETALKRLREATPPTGKE